MRDRSAFVPCIPVRSMDRHLTESVRTSLGIKALRSLVRGELYWVASAAASAALRTLPRYLPWRRRDALHPSAPDTTRVARLNQRFPRVHPLDLRRKGAKTLRKAQESKHRRHALVTGPSHIGDCSPDTGSFIPFWFSLRLCAFASKV